MATMSSTDYNRFLQAIKQANDDEDKKALSQIQKKLIAEYDSDDENVYYLLNQFRYRL